MAEKKEKVTKNQKIDKQDSKVKAKGSGKTSVGKKKEVKKSRTQSSKKKVDSSDKATDDTKVDWSKEIRPGYFVKVIHLSPDGKRDFTTSGVVMRVRGGGNNKTFTVRAMVGGIGVEKVFSFASPALKNIEVIKKVSPRRARLYFLRSEKVSPAKKSKYL